MTKPIGLTVSLKPGFTIHVDPRVATICLRCGLPMLDHRTFLCEADTKNPPAKPTSASNP